MAEAVASALPSGAGCSAWEVWPVPNQFRQNGADPGIGILNKYGLAPPNLATLNYNLNMNRGWNVAVDGRSGATIGATVAGAPNGMQYAYEGWVAHPGKRGIAGAPNLFTIDQYGVYSLQMTAWFVTLPGALAATVDHGLEWCTAGGGTLNDGQMLRLGTPGMGFRVHDTNAVEAIVRGVQAGAVARQTLLTAADGYLSSRWHNYEMRIVAANGPTEALAKWFIDGRLMFSTSWGGAITMPETNGLNEGLKAFTVTNGGNTTGFVISNMIYRVARDEVNLA